MKKTIQLLAFVLLFVAANLQVNAQTTIAYVDSEAIIQSMPAYKGAKAEVEAYGKQLQKQVQGSEKKMMTYYQDIMQKAQKGLLSPKQQQDAEAKVKKMQEDLQKQIASSEQKLVKKEQTLLAPIESKFENALSTIAKAKGYNYILDKKVLLYSKGGIDATAAVKGKLGL